MAIAVIVFLNLLHGKDALKSSEPKQNGTEWPPRANVKKVLQTPSEPDVPRLRVCPLCGTVLSSEDYLIAALAPESESGSKRQAHIYGCRYCYATEGVNLRSGELAKMKPW